MQLVLPIKRFAEAKTRLAQALSLAKRRELSATLLEGILEEISRTPLITRVVLASSEPEAFYQAQKYGYDFLPDTAVYSSLNLAVARATNFLIDHGARDVGVILCDLPLISSGELSRVIQRHLTGSPRQLTLVPDRHGEGTNVRLCRPGNLIPAQYGRNSAIKHQAAAIEAGANVVVVRSETLGLDVDLSADCAEVVATWRRSSERRASPAVRLLESWFGTEFESGVRLCG